MGGELIMNYFKINLQNKEITTEALPKCLKGLKQESLNDLSWTDESLGLQNFGFWLESDVTAYDENQVLDGTESYTLDEVNFKVLVTKGQRDKTDEELQAEFKATVPQTVTKRQARLALLESGLLTTIDEAIANSTDEALKIEWEYADIINREWDSLIALATILGMTEQQLDELFILAGSK